jgi:hypothetical protein
MGFLARGALKGASQARKPMLLHRDFDHHLEHLLGLLPLEHGAWASFGHKMAKCPPLMCSGVTSGISFHNAASFPSE